MTDQGPHLLPAAKTPAQLARTRRRLAGEILSFSTIHELGRVFVIQGWGLAREVQELVAMAKQDDDPSAKLRAIAMLRQLRLDALRMSGVIARVQATRTMPDGEQQRVSVDRIISNIPSVDEMLDEERGTNPNEEFDEPITPDEPVEEVPDAEAEREANPGQP